MHNIPFYQYLVLIFACGSHRLGPSTFVSDFIHFIFGEKYVLFWGVVFLKCLLKLPSASRGVMKNMCPGGWLVGCIFGEDYSSDCLLSIYKVILFRTTNTRPSRQM